VRVDIAARVHLVAMSSTSLGNVSIAGQQLVQVVTVQKAHQTAMLLMLDQRNAFIVVQR
jgi:hypothetical protein